jgi:glycosyltransferase involved in cell wall biosynthesis
MLGTDEGFGIPFVEALAAGCQVIATDHPLAREVVGDAGLLIAAGNPAAVGQQLVEPPAVPAKGRARHMMRFSWTAFGQAYEAELLKIARPRRERREVNLGCSA